MSGYEKVWLNKSASKWVDTPVKVVWGIQLNPAYLDGVDTDREGNELTNPNRQHSSLIVGCREQSGVTIMTT